MDGGEVWTNLVKSQHFEFFNTSLRELAPTWMWLNFGHLPKTPETFFKLHIVRVH